MAPERGGYKVNPSEILAVVSSTEKPVWTVQEIANRLGVSEPTVHNHIGAVEEMPGVKSKKIGRSTVYWYEIADDEDSLLDVESAFGVSPAFELLIDARANWLWSVNAAYESIAADDGIHPLARARLWKVLKKYARRSKVWTAIKIDTEESEEGNIVYKHREGKTALPQQANLDTLDYYLFDLPMFESEWFGTVRGVAGLTEFDRALSRELEARASEEGTVDPDDLTDQDVDELYPSLHELVGIGATLDHLITQIYNVDW